MEQTILEAFLFNHKLKFSEIEKLTKIRSNKLSYHLKKLEKKEMLTKEKDFYKLTEAREDIIPYLTNKKSVLPVILITIKKGDNIFLHKREKRPFKNKLSLPGGRILLGETIPKATERIAKEKFNIKCKFQKINSISLEYVKKNNKIIHSFLLILTTATSSQNIGTINPTKNKSKIISSDYKLITKDLDKEIKIKNILTRA